MDFKLTDFIFTKKKLLGKDECEFLINEYNKKIQESEVEQSIEASTNKMAISSFKRIGLQPGSRPWKLVFDATESIINEYHDYLDSFDMFHVGYRTALAFSHQHRILRYGPGESIHPHIDHSPFIYGSCTINLNEDYEGGEFSWFKGKHTIKLSQGEALIFPADFFWVHEVKPVVKGFRYSVNSFLQQIPSSIMSHVRGELDHILNNLDDFPKFKHDYAFKYNIKEKS